VTFEAEESGVHDCETSRVTIVLSRGALGLRWEMYLWYEWTNSRQHETDA